jgi:peptidyl-prolyl cis-trans isomerase C
MRPLSLVTAGLVAALLSTSAIAQTPAPQAGVGGQAAAPAQPSPDTVVARVDGIAITEADLAIAAADPALSLPNMSEAQKRDLLIGYLVDLKIGARAAEAAKVAEGRDFARRLAYFKDKLLLDEYLESEVAKAVTPEATCSPRRRCAPATFSSRARTRRRRRSPA